ncbi:MAG: hypothetical protein ACRCXH_08175, partial [Shewanella sp.]
NATLANGELQPQRWYVIKSQAYGEPVIGLLHTCIPCGDSDQIQLSKDPELSIASLADKYDEQAQAESESD